MRRAAKTLLLFSSITLCLLLLIPLRIILALTPKIRRPLVTSLVHFFGKIFVAILGIKVILSGRKELLKKRGVFFVSNHLSYIDGILAISLSPLIFIGKSDLRKWSFFGFFISLSETIFVNRNSPACIQAETQSIVSALSAGINVILFPEGTSTNGEKLLPFKSSFFAAPLKAKKLIVPLVIQYKGINRKAINNANKNLVYWYDNMKFLPHLLKVLELEEIVIEVKVCEAIEAPGQDTQGSASGRKYLCEITRQRIESCLTS